MTAGIGKSIDGWIDDDMAFVWPWGFDVRDITVPVQVWQGREDKFVPFGHGEWFVRNIPTAESHLSDTDGHLTLLVNRIPEIHAWLLSHA
jgi:pimeloyl-ACP methyl ester carboxylesterase